MISACAHASVVKQWTLGQLQKAQDELSQRRQRCEWSTLRLRAIQIELQARSRRGEKR